MAQLIIRQLDESIKENLKKRAALHGISMEAEVRLILANVLKSPPSTKGLGSRIAARFSKVGLDEPLPELKGEEIGPMVFE